MNDAIKDDDAIIIEKFIPLGEETTLEYNLNKKIKEFIEAGYKENGEPLDIYNPSIFNVRNME